jgi:hypothetical protein
MPEEVAEGQQRTKRRKTASRPTQEVDERIIAACLRFFPWGGSQGEKGKLWKEVAADCNSVNGVKLEDSKCVTVPYLRRPPDT